MVEKFAAELAEAQQFFDSSLFHDVQMARIFADSKTFADASPKLSVSEILDKYSVDKTADDFVLLSFIQKYFVLPEEPRATPSTFSASTSNISDYIEQLWTELTRQPCEQSNETSLLSLPNPYIIPGGRFREIYYWDSYFTALGLIDSGQSKLVVNMVDNFFYLQQTVGSIPNGNRTYYVGRSQPPVLALLVELLLDTPKLLSKNQSDEFMHRAIIGLRHEYDFWMQGYNDLSPQNPTEKRTVRLADGTILNRYWDEHDTPRPESYFEDVEHAKGVKNKAEFWRNLRAACESGWDFSSRWLTSSNDLTSINTTSLLPVDLNCLILELERVLARLYQQVNKNDLAAEFELAAKARKDAILSLFWSDVSGSFYDYDFINNTHTNVLSAACFLPMYFNLATQEQAARTVAKAKQKLIGKHGIHTTNITSSQQWDHTNGWAPLQWFAYQGLSHYGYDQDAKQLATDWCNMVEAFFNKHHCLMEKYNLNDPLTFARGGEYDVQHGFGWTNGVTVALLKRLESV